MLAVEHLEQRLDTFVAQLDRLAQEERYAVAVAVLRCFRGFDTITAVTIVDVLPGHSSTVTAVFDVDVGARDARTLPPSLHLFDRGRLG